MTLTRCNRKPTKSGGIVRYCAGTFSVGDNDPVAPKPCLPTESSFDKDVVVNMSVVLFGAQYIWFPSIDTEHENWDFCESKINTICMCGVIVRLKFTSPSKAYISPGLGLFVSEVFI